MKNRLLDYGLASDEPETPKAPKTPGKKTRAPKGKSKRLICRVIQWLGPERKYVNGKLCLYLDGSGQYYIRGKAVSAAEALRRFSRWMTDSDTERDFIDEGLMAQLVDTVMPHREPEPEPEAPEDDGDGDEWKAAAE